MQTAQLSTLLAQNKVHVVYFRILANKCLSPCLKYCIFGGRALAYWNLARRHGQVLSSQVMYSKSGKLPGEWFDSINECDSRYKLSPVYFWFYTTRRRRGPHPVRVARSTRVLSPTLPSSRRPWLTCLAIYKWQTRLRLISILPLPALLSALVYSIDPKREKKALRTWDQHPGDRPWRARRTASTSSWPSSSRPWASSSSSAAG